MRDTGEKGELFSLLMRGDLMPWEKKYIIQVNILNDASV
jgi:hypothetical protein